MVCSSFSRAGSAAGSRRPLFRRVRSREIKKFTDHFPLSTEQPDLKHLHRDVVGALQGECLVQPEMSLVFRFSLHKDRSQLPAGSDVLDHRFINGLFEFEQVSENLVCQLWGKFAENLVALHVNRRERLIVRWS